jgi:sugar lactone lactonase YvrE
MLGPAIHRMELDPEARHANAVESWPVSRLTSLAVPRRGGGYLLAQPSGLRLFDPERGVDEPFAHPEAKRAGNRYNDGKCDPRGRLWIGTMDPGGQPGRGSLLRVDPDGAWERMDTGFTVANGIAFAPDAGTLYFAESAGRTVLAYDFDVKRGAIARRRPQYRRDPPEVSPAAGRQPQRAARREPARPALRQRRPERRAGAPGARNA